MRACGAPGQVGLPRPTTIFGGQHSATLPRNCSPGGRGPRGWEIGWEVAARSPQGVAQKSAREGRQWGGGCGGVADFSGPRQPRVCPRPARVLTWKLTTGPHAAHRRAGYHQTTGTAASRWPTAWLTRRPPAVALDLGRSRGSGQWGRFWRWCSASW